MAARHLLLLLALVCLHAPHWASAQQPEEATVIVKGSTKFAETDVNYICATIDWWPPEKCNYNQCPWGQSSILNLDLDHPFLAQAIQEFDNLRIRLGGSLQDRVVYDVGTDSPCSPFTNVSNGLFGFSAGCLSMDRWDKLNDLFQKTGAIITFGLNALRGRYKVQRSLWAGKWNSTNAYDFVKYTISKGYPVDSWEFGNELSGHGTGARVDAKLYGKDVTELKSILRQLYRAPLSQPLLLAPGGFFDQQWYTQLLQTSGHGVVNALTHHIYNLGGGDDVHLMRKIVDPKYLDRAEDTYRDMQLTLQRHGTWASAWVSESGGVFNNGRQLVSNTFMNSIWYLDQLGMASKYNTKVFCRQTLIGGNYGLLDTQTFLPNPDYYSALLWHRLMGNGVLSVDINAPRKLRAYAHCSKRHKGITLLLINLSNSTEYNVTLQNDLNVSVERRSGHRRHFLPDQAAAALPPGTTANMAAVLTRPTPGTVQCFGRKKTAVAVAYTKPGRGLIKVNGAPIELIRPEMLRLKAFEPIMLAGRSRFKDIDMRIRVRGGGKTSQIYAIRQAVAKALVAYYQKYVDEAAKKEVKDIFARYDRTLLVADPRRCEPKKFGGRGARARFQKSYR